jgi:hypothetical protein
MGIYGNCFKTGCNEKLHGINSKLCNLCGNRVCTDHFEYKSHDCPKAIYEKYIKKEKIRTYGQNLSGGLYSIVCETCGFISDFPSLIEYSGADLEEHLKSNPECMTKKRTFLKELKNEPIEKPKIHSSIIRDPDRSLWVCSLCSPPRKFTSHDEYIAHHYTHS